MKGRAAQYFRGNCHFGPDARVHALTSAAPLSSNLRDFPGTLRKRAPDYPFGGNHPIGMDSFTFQKFITRSRSFCLRVSGAVAPSAPSFAEASEGVSREGSCAWPTLQRLRRTGMLQSIIKRGRGESMNAGNCLDLFTFFREFRCPTGPEPRSEPIKPMRKAPAGRPADPHPSRTGRDVRHKSG